MIRDLTIVPTGVDNLTIHNVTIADTMVSGFDVGTLVDGTYGREVPAAPDRDGPTGRIKFGTESNGGSATSPSRT